MKKLIYFLFLISISTSYAQIPLDTLSSRFVGPGVLYTKIRAASVPWNIDVLRIDLKNPYLKLETVKAKDKFKAYETTSSMAKRRSYDGHYVVGAVNGDYYNTADGSMTNIQIGQGQILRTPTKHTLIGFDDKNRPMIGFVNFDGKLIKDGNAAKIHNVNANRGKDSLILYNYYWGATTFTDNSGSEALIRPLDGWAVNDTLECIVENVGAGVGNMAITSGRGVLSGNGTAAAFIANNLHVGDTVKILQGITPGLSRLMEMLGGRPKMVNKGINYVETALKSETGSSTYTREPRTAAGISQDSTYLYLITLDGRTPNSVGATLDELAEVMIRLGVYTGLNLDGGGSTTMVVRHSIMNYPSSSGVERAVGNCLLIVSSAPSSPDSLTQIGFNVYSRKFKVYKKEQLQFGIWGNDKYNNPVDLDPTQIKYSVDPSIGAVDQNGLFTAGNSAAQGYLYTRYKGFADSVYIVVKAVSKIDVNPKNFMVNLIKPVQLSVKAYDADNIQRTIYPGDIVLASTDTSVATVSANGAVKGKAEGKAKIIATYQGLITDTVNVSVQNGRGSSLLESFESTANWKVSGINIDTSYSKVSVCSTEKSQGAGSFKVDYKFTFNSAVPNTMYLDTKIPVYGIPDTMFIDTKSDSASHWLSFIFTDDNDESFRVNAYGYTDNPSEFTTIPVPLQSFAALGSGQFYYPIQLTRIEVNLRYKNSSRVNGETYSGAIYLDNLRLRYPEITTSVGSDGSRLSNYVMMQNYPNPFNPATTISYDLPMQSKVELKVFDLLGREVASLINEDQNAGHHSIGFDGSSLSSGMYIYRINAGEFVQTRKMMLLK
ncbi:MAG: phosphodiester glycosidase family protein [Bacillota bacterium]